jgi:hypothetical protein
MIDWVESSVPVIQLVLNGTAIVGGSFIWNLYVKNLRASIQAKSDAIESVERNRDMWRDKCQELEKRTPEKVEETLARRIKIRDEEISRLSADSEESCAAIEKLENERIQIKQDMYRTQGFRTMLALEEGVGAKADQIDFSMDGELEIKLPTKKSVNIEVVKIGSASVDSGQLMISDPAYIDSQWAEYRFDWENRIVPNENGSYPFSYNGSCQATASENGFGELAFIRGHAGAGVAFATAYGDGDYPIYAEKHDGRIVRVYVNVG